MVSVCEGLIDIGTGTIEEIDNVYVVKSTILCSSPQHVDNCVESAEISVVEAGANGDT